jgi:hypothetical protein
MHSPTAQSLLARLRLLGRDHTVSPERGSLIGRTFLSESSARPDPLTGREVLQLTNSIANDQHPYFTGPALTSDGRTLVFISERSGHPNLFTLDFPSGQITQLTDNRYGVLRSYVYPWGSLSGLGKASVVLHAPSGDIYYLQGRQLRVVNARTLHHRAIADLPAGFVSAFMHVDPLNRRVCIPLVDEAAFEGSAAVTIPTYHPAGFGSIGRRVRERKLESHLLVVSTDGTSADVWASVPSAWITHVQFRPTTDSNSDLLLFNHEALEGPGMQRIWMIDGLTRRIWKIRPEPGDGNHWNCHEVWTADGSKVFYHGAGIHPQTRQKTNLFGWSAPDGLDYHETYLPNDEASGYGHFAEHPTPGTLITDGYFQGGQILATVREGSSPGWGEWQPLCHHGSQWLYQDDHPHPIVSPDGQWCVFTSSARGTANVYAVRL